ncbi:MAG: cupin domain-containing protein [Candidatus Glassbacteria bacterium]|nr:cupin domain-containing protein [Candidatus Glassbacteria bacterium]
MPIVKKNALELKSFDEKKFNPVGIYQSDQIKVIVAYFKPLQFIPVHTPGVDVVFFIIEGQAEIVAGDQRMTVKENDLVIVPKGTKRGIKALTELTVLHLVQPPPTEADHREVREKISLGKFE